MSKSNLIIKRVVLLVGLLFAQNILADSNSDMTDQIKQSIASQVPNSASNIQVTINNGVVYLTGNVNSLSDATAAIQAANSVSGVSDVNTQNLMVQNGAQTDPDAYITARVQGLFTQQNLYGNAPQYAGNIRVETHDGVVYLYGTSETMQQQNNAVTMIKSMDGVKDVVSNVAGHP